MVGDFPYLPCIATQEQKLREGAFPSVVPYFLRYIHAASASSTIVKTQRDELLIPVFFAMC